MATFHSSSAVNVRCCSDAWPPRAMPTDESGSCSSMGTRMPGRLTDQPPARPPTWSSGLRSDSTQPVSMIWTPSSHWSALVTRSCSARAIATSWPRPTFPPSPQPSPSATIRLSSPPTSLTASRALTRQLHAAANHWWFHLDLDVLATRRSLPSGTRSQGACPGRTSKRLPTRRCRRRVWLVGTSRSTTQISTLTAAERYNRHLSGNDAQRPELNGEAGSPRLHRSLTEKPSTR